MTNDRLIKILEILLNSDDYITATQLANELNVSSRTIFNDINSSEFSKMLKGTRLITTPNKGLKLECSNEQRNKLMKCNYYFHSSSTKTTDDLYSLSIYLLNTNTFVSLEEISLDLFTNRNKIAKLLGPLSKEIGKYELSLYKNLNKGIKIIGDEIAIRNYYYHCIKTNLSLDMSQISFCQELASIFPKEMVSNAESIIKQSELLLNETYTHTDHFYLLIRLCILVQRIKLGFTINCFTDSKNLLKETCAAIFIAKNIEGTFKVPVSQNEINEIAKYILQTRRVTNSITLSQSNLNKTIVKFISALSNALSIDLTNDKELQKNLMSHLHLTIDRIKMGLYSDNPLLTYIKSHYVDVYISVMLALETIEEAEHIHFDPNEIGFICLHVLASINRITKNKYIKTVLICNGGLSVEVYLKSRLEKEINDIDICLIVTTNQFNTITTDEFDLIIDTTGKPINNNKTVHCSVIVEDEDIQRIRNALFTIQIISIYDSQKDLDSQIRLYRDNLSSKKQLLEKYCTLLKVDEYVDSNFIFSVLERENLSPTAIGYGTAIPHGISKYVRNSCIVIIRLDQPVLWNTDVYVDLVFLSAIDVNSTTNNALFYRRLFKCISNKETRNTLMNASSANDLQFLFEAFPKK